MNGIVKAIPSALGGRPDWMPDVGVYTYVRDILDEVLGLDASRFPEEWLPLGIVGTMDWLAICGWWVWEYTGVFDTDEPYKWVFTWDNVYEFDPDKLLVFREDPDWDLFSERMENPDLDHKERTEALQFLLQDVYPDWEIHPPPRIIAESILWATLMWVLSDYGRDWLYMQDPIFGHVYDHGVAYVDKWSSKLLDPKLMRRTERQIGTCKSCGERLWCVLGYYSKDNDGGENRWEYMCNHCAVMLKESGTAEMDEHDDRLLHPHCPAFEGSCMSTKCPHNHFTKENIREAMEEWGSSRLNEWREDRRMSGASPRRMSGQTAEDIVDYFGRERED